MDRIARPNDDLFESSTMTFGEHLEELRQCLVRAILWLAGGMVIGLLFANQVILFIQRPLETAIHEFHAKRDLFQMGYEDPDADEVKPIRGFMSEHSLTAEIIFAVPKEYQSLAASSITATTSSQTLQADGVQGVVDPTELADLLRSLPSPDVLKPMVQFRKTHSGLSSLKLEEPFMIWVKAGLVVGAVIASPMIFYHLWSFIAAGLHAHERRYVYVYLPVSVSLFVAGVVLAFFMVLHYVLSFLLAFNGSMNIAAEPRLTYYVNFVLMLPLGFGIAFQLPIVMLFLQRIGLLETQAYVDSWKVAVLVIFVIAMIVTPADVTSMIALAIPLVFLYVLGILMCKFIPRGRGLGSDAYDPS